jgi:hypothetical protein
MNVSPELCWNISVLLPKKLEFGGATYTITRKRFKFDEDKLLNTFGKCIS